MDVGLEVVEPVAPANPLAVAADPALRMLVPASPDEALVGFVALRLADVVPAVVPAARLVGVND